MLIEQRDSLRGEITVPGDKSISHRAIVLGSLAMGTTEIDGFLMGEDCLSTIDCFRKMQVGIEILSNNKVKVHGKGLYGLKPPTTALNAGRSGTSARLILGVLSGQPFNSTLTRDDSSKKKSLRRVVKSLREMNCVISGKEEGSFCPLTISPAVLKGVCHELSSVDSHIKSPILLAGLYANGETSVIEAVKSRDHSELMLKHFGVDVRVDGLKVSFSKCENLFAQHVIVPGDMSIASYFITAGLLVPGSDITIKNVGINATRTGILDVFISMGANIEILNEREVSSERVADIRVTTSALTATTIDGDIIPRLIDEIPVIAVAATLAKGRTVIKNLDGYKLKESGRIKGLVAELSKMGAKVQETDDGMIIEGGKQLRGTVVECYSDHTIAMALSIAGLIADGETMIRKAQIVDVVFPDFLPILNKL